MRIDLHTHSTASDGTLSPAEVVRAAASAELDVVALTDHDSTRGWDEAAEALALGQTLVPGAEVSCAYDGISLHMLAYLFDPADPPLLAELERTRTDRVPRAQEMVRRLAAAGYPITWAQVVAEAGAESTVGRPHIADALVRSGAVGSRDEAFIELLHPRSPYHVRHYAPDPFTIVEAVRAAGGVTVFAHPGAALRGRVVPPKAITDLAAAGLTGIEVDHVDHDPVVRQHLRGLAVDLGLVATGSSDFHGAGKANRLGQDTTPPAAYEALVAQATARQPVTR